MSYGAIYNQKLNLPKLSNPASSENIAYGYQGYDQDGEIVTGNVPIQDMNQIIDLTYQNATYNIQNGFYTRGGVRANIPNLIPSNVKEGVNAGGAVGTATPSNLINVIIDASSSGSTYGRVVFTNSWGRTYNLSVGSSTEIRTCQTESGYIAYLHWYNFERSTRVSVSPRDDVAIINENTYGNGDKTSSFIFIPNSTQNITINFYY